MTKRLIRNNINELNKDRDRVRNRVSTATLQKINNVIELYEDRLIVQYGTADKLIKGLAQRNEKARAKGEKAYDKAVEKYEGKERVSDKQEQALKKARDTKVKNRVDRKLSERFTPEQLKRKREKAQEVAGKNKKNLSVQYMLFSKENRSDAKKASFIYRGDRYYPLLVKPAVRLANIKADQKFMTSNVKKKIHHYYDKFLFKKVMMSMRSDKSFDRMLEEPFYHYIDIIRLESVDLIEGDGEFNVEDEDLTDAKNISIYNKYVETEVDIEALTIKEAIMKKDYVENECWINALNDHFKDTLMRHKRGSLAKNITREKILDIIGKTDEEFKRDGASIRNMMVLFDEFNIKTRLYDVNGNTIYRNDPEDFNSKRIPTFNGLIKNNHIYTINSNLASLKAKTNEEKHINIKISNNYYINNKEAPIPCKMIKKVDDILQLREEEEYNLILEDNDLTGALYYLMKSGYEPYINWEAGKISEIKIKLTYKLGKRKTKEVKYNIKTQSLGRGRVDEDVAVSTEEKYNNVNQAFFDLNKAVFNEGHKSFYSDVDVKVLDNCRTIIPHGIFHKIIDGYVMCADTCNKREIDCCKAFTKAFTEIKKVGVFRECDVWRPFTIKDDISRMNNYTMYIVKACQGNVFFNKVYNLVQGKILKELIKDGVVCKILYYKIPAYTYKVQYDKLIDDLWCVDLSEDTSEDKRLKKQIANITFGLMEKGENRKSQSRVYTNLNEALHQQRVNGGRLYVIKELELEEINDEEVVRNRDDKYYVLTVSESRTLVNGFRYIKEQLLQNHNFRMYKAYKALKENNVRVYAVKTDAYHIHKNDVRKARRVLDFHNGIGGWRLESDDVKQLTVRYSWKYNELPKIPVYENNTLVVDNEWDAMEICKMILPYKSCLITAKFPGSGKSHICKQFEKLGYNTLFVVPQNMLTQEIEGFAITLNKFFSIPVHKGDELPYYDHSDFDAIIFDEIYMANPYIQNKIYKFKMNNPNKIVIGAGDVKQLPSIQSVSNTQPADVYMDRCLNITFKHNIFLKICKRVGDEDRVRLNEIYDDLWVRMMPIREWIMKHFKLTNDVMNSDHNIAYTNMRCQAVSNEIRKRLGKTEKYEIGEVMICRLYRHAEEGKFNVNIRWKIIGKKWNSNSSVYLYKIQDIKDDDDVRTVDEYVLNNHFRYAYCATCHSRQGASISGNITIHEWDKDYLVSREWIWCAMTRARDLNKVYFFKNDKCNEEMERGLVIEYFKNKIEGYKHQDRKGKREIDEENYIDLKWCVDNFKNGCGKCGVRFDFDKFNGKMSSNFTAQRLENSIGHTKDNCVSWCRYCNCSAS